MNIQMRMNHVVNEDYNNILFAMTTKEIVKVQVFFDSFKNGFKDLRTMARGVLKREKDILNFDWPNERTHDQWKTNHSMAIEKVRMTAEDKMINWAKEEEPNNKGI